MLALHLFGLAEYFFALQNKWHKEHKAAKDKWPWYLIPWYLIHSRPQCNTSFAPSAHGNSFPPICGAILKIGFPGGRTTENMPVHFRAVDNAVETVKKVKEYVNNGFGVTLDVALDLEEVCKESERVKELEDTMIQYVEMEREMDHWVKAAELAKAEFNRQYDASRWVFDVRN